ncbi:MAG: hypothetical protein ABFR90_12220 [Planctomycetota bacterium]
MKKTLYFSSTPFRIVSFLLVTLLFCRHVQAYCAVMTYEEKRDMVLRKLCKKNYIFSKNTTALIYNAYAQKRFGMPEKRQGFLYASNTPGAISA